MSAQDSSASSSGQNAPQRSGVDVPASAQDVSCQSASPGSSGVRAEETAPGAADSPSGQNGPPQRSAARFQASAQDAASSSCQSAPPGPSGRRAQKTAPGPADSPSDSSALPQRSVVRFHERFSSIRFRLAAWYFVSFAVILGLFALGTWIAMRAGVRRAVDRDLAQRIRDVRQFTEQELDLGQAELLEELQEHSLLGLGGGLLQLSDGEGRVLFRSGRLKNTSFDLVEPAPGDLEVHYAYRRAAGAPVRVASQRVVVKDQRFLIQVAEPMHSFNETLERFEATLLILAPFFLLLACAGGFWMSTRALAPVDRITNDARAISGSNLSARLEKSTAKDELQRLTQTLNEMLDRIEAEVKRIVQFTADASHELRAPLTLIHTAAEFSLRRERTREELTDAMRKIVRESERTARLVDDLLLLARADSNTHELRLAPTDISSTGRDAADLAVTLARAKNIEVSADIPRDPLIMTGNQHLLEQLWLILLDNAVKYTPAGGRVRFSMQAVNSHLETTVTDTGIGIAESDLPHVYDRFWRADKVRSRDAGGSGLGLSIARWIVQCHRGEIEIDSEPGHGSRVTVRFPLARN